MAKQKHAAGDSGVRAKRRSARSAIDDVRTALLASQGIIVSYEADTPIFRQGDPADWIFFILRGRIQISVVSKQGKEGIIALPLTVGEFCGESSLTNQRLYLASARGVNACEVIKMPHAAMSALVKKTPSSARPSQPSCFSTP